MPFSGKEISKAFIAAGWKLLRTRGSHKTYAFGELRETIPMHDELATGTEHELLKSLKKSLGTGPVPKKVQKILKNKKL